MSEKGDAILKMVLNILLVTLFVVTWAHEKKRAQ